MEPNSSPGEEGRNAYSFDGEGGVREKGWNDIDEGSFCWYNLELPKWVLDKEKYIGDVFKFHPRLQDIISLVNPGFACQRIGRDMMFRLNSPGPYPQQKLAVLITANAVITLCQGDLPISGFTAVSCPIAAAGVADLMRLRRDHPVPRTITDLVVHIVNAYTDNLCVMVSKLEMEIVESEELIIKGGGSLKKLMIEEERLSKKHLDIQHLLLVISHGEQVLCMFHNMEGSDGIAIAIAQLGGLKEILGLLADRVCASKNFLNGWRRDQISKRRMYFSVLSIIILFLVAINAKVMGMGLTSIMSIGVSIVLVMGMWTRR